MNQQAFPHDLELERAVLGGVMHVNDVLADIPRLEADAFFDGKNRLMWEAIRALENRSEPIDAVMIGHELQRAGKIDALASLGRKSGHDYIDEVAAAYQPTERTFVPAYAKRLDNLWMLRRMMLLGGELTHKARLAESDVDAGDVLDEILAQLAALGQSRADESMDVSELVAKRLEQVGQIMQDRLEGKSTMSGIPTGIKALDAKLGGWPLCIVSLICARPAMGKSAMAMASTKAAVIAGHGVHVFSMEDSWMAYGDRVLAGESGVAVNKLRQGDLNREEWLRAVTASGRVRSYGERWRIDSRGGLTAHDIVRSARRWKRKLGTKMVVVDYAHLVKKAVARGQTEEQALNDVMAVFVEAAKVDEVAYLVLVQLNRKVEERVDKRPMLSDIRGSGGFEEKAKVAVCPYRGSQYGPPVRGVDYECECPRQVARCYHAPSDEEFATRVQVVIAKDNNGAQGRVWATWDGPTTTMS